MCLSKDLVWIRLVAYDMNDNGAWQQWQRRVTKACVQWHVSLLQWLTPGFCPRPLTSFPIPWRFPAIRDLTYVTTDIPRIHNPTHEHHHPTVCTPRDVNARLLTLPGLLTSKNIHRSLYVVQPVYFV